ncbi:MAG TPA: hypothetical protein VEI02_11235 [Planctomycetota bacterium]|nr:hypothetical protein [Planctomycetota bacterium]
MAPPPDGSVAQRLARMQGVHRPFDLLASAAPSLRERMAQCLGVRLGRAASDPRREAWVLINADLRGLQARSHSPDRVLLPRRNHNWWEILLAAARRLGLDVYPGLSEREVERLVFDRTARLLVEGLEAAEREVLDLVARETPSFTDAFDRLNLSDDGRALVLAAFHRIAQATPCADAEAVSSSRRSAAYLRAGLERAGVMPSASRSLRYLRDGLPKAFAAWTAVAAARNLLPRASRPLALCLAALHLHGAVTECVEELEALRL